MINIEMSEREVLNKFSTQTLSASQVHVASKESQQSRGEHKMYLALAVFVDHAIDKNVAYKDLDKSMKSVPPLCDVSDLMLVKTLYQVELYMKQHAYVRDAAFDDACHSGVVAVYMNDPEGGDDEYERKFVVDLEQVTTPFIASEELNQINKRYLELYCLTVAELRSRIRLAGATDKISRLDKHQLVVVLLKYEVDDYKLMNEWLAEYNSNRSDRVICYTDKSNVKHLLSW